MKGEPSVNECKQLLNAVRGEKKKNPFSSPFQELPSELCGYSYPAPQLTLKIMACFWSEDSAAAKPLEFCAYLYFSLELLVWDLIEVCWPSPRANALMLGSTPRARWPLLRLLPVRLWHCFPFSCFVQPPRALALGTGPWLQDQSCC